MAAKTVANKRTVRTTAAKSKESGEGSGAGANKAGAKSTGKGRTRKAAVKILLEKVEDNLVDGDVKASVGDYIRLMQLHKELEETEPKEIRVSWVTEKDQTESGD
jgi:hypothetical protein